MAPHSTADEQQSHPQQKATVKPIPRDVIPPKLATPQPEGVNPPNFPHKHIKVIPLAPTFTAEIQNVDFSKPISDEVFQEILAAWSQYGIIVFRKTGLTPDAHIEFSRKFGELDDIGKFINPNDPSIARRRYPQIELFDVSNLDNDGNILQEGHRKFKYNKGNNLWHVDSTFNPRKASYSLLVGHEVPPRGTGGETDFADARTAYDDLDQEMKDKIENLVVEHSLWHSRLLADENYVASDFEKNAKPPCRHSMVHVHQPSGRKSLYVAAHAANVVGMDQKTEGLPLIWDLIEHATQPKYTVRMQWLDNGDMVCWDNMVALHRGVSGGEFLTKYRRDAMRTTVHDSSPVAWGFNKPEGVEV